MPGGWFVSRPAAWLQFTFTDSGLTTMNYQGIWLLDPRHAARVSEAAAAARADDGTKRLAMAKQAATTGRKTQNRVAVIDISGSLEARQTLMGWLMGSLPMDQLADVFLSAV